MMSGAILLLIGAVLQVNQLIVAPYIYTVGALLFGYVQIVGGRYEGANLMIRRRNLHFLARTPILADSIL